MERRESRPLWGAVLPAAPEKYDQEWMSRLTDIVRKLVEQLTEPMQMTAASVVFTDLPQETPRYDQEGEVFTRVCSACGVTVLAINQTISEGEQYAQRRRLRARAGPTASNEHHADPGPQASEGGS